MAKNYYEIMGLSQNATEKEIKTAYRRLARKYHPDISKEADAESRFKEMGEAYDVLKDPKKRAQYDEQLKYGAFHDNAPHQNTGNAYHYQHYGTEDKRFNDDLFESLFGHKRYQTQPMPGQDYRGSVQISLEEAFHGTERSIQVPSEKGSQTLKVKIPKGVKEGQQIRLAGQGAPGYHGGPAGDIYLTIHIEKHPLFEVMENDIYLTLPISPWEAALGSTITVPTLAGKIDLKIPENSQGGQKLRLKQRGLPGKHHGDQYVLLKIVTPPAKTEEAKTLYQKMASTMPFNPRAQMGV